MRFMVIVKASKDSEAGKMPSHELLAAMGKYNEELVKAGIMLSGEGLHPSSKGARALLGRAAYRRRRPVYRNQGADRGLLDVAGEVEGRGHRVGQALPQPDAWHGSGDRDPSGIRERGLWCGVHAGIARAGRALARPDRQASSKSRLKLGVNRRCVSGPTSSWMNCRGMTITAMASRSWRASTAPAC